MKTRQDIARYYACLMHEAGKGDTTDEDEIARVNLARFLSHERAALTPIPSLIVLLKEQLVEAEEKKLKEIIVLKEIIDWFEGE